MQRLRRKELMSDLMSLEVSLLLLVSTQWYRRRELPPAPDHRATESVAAALIAVVNCQGPARKVALTNPRHQRRALPLPSRQWLLGAKGHGLHVAPRFHLRPQWLARLCPLVALGAPQPSLAAACQR